MTDDWNVFEHGAKEDPLIRMTWRVYTMLDSNDVHIIPVDDEIPHELIAQCSCAPVAEPVLFPGFPGEEGVKYVHNDKDGRAPLEETV